MKYVKINFESTNTTRNSTAITNLVVLTSIYTANVFAVKFTGFPCVPLEPCKVHVFITGKWVPSQSL